MKLKGIKPSKNFEDRRQPQSTLKDNVFDQIARSKGRPTVAGEVGYENQFSPDSMKGSRRDKVDNQLSNYSEKTDFNNGKTNRETYKNVDSALRNMGVIRKSK
jgi:hypothetical protein